MNTLPCVICLVQYISIVICARQLYTSGPYLPLLLIDAGDILFSGTTDMTQITKVTLDHNW
jgi:hypothetical protein